MIKVKDIALIIEEAAPLAWQEDFDNAGLLVGDPDSVVKSALLCVDITEKVLAEAVELRSDMIISHHPVIFHPLKHITNSTYIERVVSGALRHNIALYACHTNLDSAPRGMSYTLGNLLGLENVSILDHLCDGGAEVPGLGVVGELPHETETMEYLQQVKKILNLDVIRYSDITRSRVKKVALCTGAGGSLIDKAKRSGAELYISSDFRYNNFLDADREIVIADVGHFESEYCAIDLLYDIIRKKIPTFALHKSRSSVNPVNYLV